MGDRTTLIRPDGTEITVGNEDAGKLRTLGYKDQTVEQEAGAAVAESTKDYYTTGTQQIKTGIEGALGGATLGLSDVAFDSMGFDTAERAGYNPGIRLGTELVGGLATLGPLGELTPAGLLTRGAKAAAEGITESKVARVAIQGAIEGGGFGGGSALTNAVVNNDPLTVESIMAGVGWGGVWGGGLGLVAGKVTQRVEAKAAARAAVEEAEQAAMQANKEAWGGFRSSVQDATSEINKATKAADQTMKASQETLGQAIKDATAARDGFLNDRLAKAEQMANQPGMGATYGPGFKAEHRAASRAYGELRSAAKAGDFERVQSALDKFKESTGNIAAMHGVVAPEISGFAAMDAKASVKAAEEVASLTAAQQHLKSLAVTPEEFASMGAAKAEKLFGAVDTVLGASQPELVGVQEGLRGGIAKMQESLGVKIEGPPSTQLRGVWETMKHSTTVKSAEEVAKATAGMGPWMKRAAGYAAGRKGSELARQMGMGGLVQTAAYEGAKTLAMSLLSIKSAVLGTVGKAAMEWVPKAAKLTAKVGPRVEPLATRLDGTVDLAKKSRRDLMDERAREIRESAGSVRDTLYKGVMPLSEQHPELASGIHQLGVEQFMWLMDKLPRDPGQAFNRLQTLWHPDPVATEQFARYYEVFQNPVAVVSRTLQTGHITPEAAEALRELSPALFVKLRVDMLDRLSNPAVLSKLSYSEQVSLGTLLQIPLHSTMTPQFVANQQQMYQQRQQLMPMPSQPGADQGGGRPPGASKNSSATSAQKITEH